MTNESSQLHDLRAVLRMLGFARVKIEKMDSNVSSAGLDPVIRAICAELDVERADEIISTDDLAMGPMGVPIGRA